MKFAQWWIGSAALLSVIIIPFLVFGESVEATATSIVAPGRGKALIAAAVILLLAADVPLPVPSSLVSASAGALLGFPLGVAICTLGMSAGCAIGYAAGYWLGTPLLRRLLGERELHLMETHFAVRGTWAVILFRAVPVLAEASVLFAGSVRARPMLVIVTSTAANAIIAAVYCATGAAASGATSWIVASLMLFGLAALAFGISRRLLAKQDLSR